MKWLLVTAIALIIIGIVGLFVFNYYSFSTGRPGMVRAPFRGPFNDSFSSNGEQIFFTGTSSRDAITATGGPFWFQMHGGGCTSCHGPDGRGGQVTMMGSFVAPNITYQELKKEGFNDRLIKRAITQGKDEKGGNLSANMPRWHMSNRDARDLIGYLKTLEP
jgi:mono/diheme cytochrome c family protein